MTFYAATGRLQGWFGRNTGKSGSMARNKALLQENQGIKTGRGPGLRLSWYLPLFRQKPIKNPAGGSDRVSWCVKPCKPPLVLSGAAETAFSPRGSVQLRNFREGHVFHLVEDHLRDLFAFLSRRRRFVVIYHYYPHLAPVRRVGGAGRVQHGDAVLQRRSRTWALPGLHSRWGWPSSARATSARSPGGFKFMAE